LKPVIAPGLTLVVGQPPCVRATFHRAGENPFFAVDATDDRGTFQGLSFDSVRPHLVEVIHSEPHVVRGNHVHMHCTEIITVLSGDMNIYLSCTCPGRHLLEERMTAGMTVTIAPGTPHALYTTTRNECVAVFGDGDPRDDRDRVVLLA
jgi:mannose-6-phosphate isomerase-like protein (cupin superfamily)